MFIFSSLMWYLSKLQIVFLKLVKCICPNCQMHLSKLQYIFVKIAKCICPPLSSLMKRKADQGRGRIETEDVFIFSPETFLLNSLYG